VCAKGGSRDDIIGSMGRRPCRVMSVIGRDSDLCIEFAYVKEGCKETYHGSEFDKSE
jgi:hypothetical protein